MMGAFGKSITDSQLCQDAFYYFSLLQSMVDFFYVFSGKENNLNSILGIIEVGSSRSCIFSAIASPSVSSSGDVDGPYFAGLLQ